MPERALNFALRPTYFRAIAANLLIDHRLPTTVIIQVVQFFGSATL